MISIVIPVHNEVDEIGNLLREFGAFEGLQLIVAEDASTDGISKIVREIASESDNILLSSSRALVGKGAAVKRGLALATGGVLGFIDGDGSIHPKDFMRVAAAVTEGADLAIGSRALRTSTIINPQPLSRRVAGSFFSLLARALLDIDVRDFQCGCKAFRREVWTSTSVTCSGFGFDAEFLGKAHHQGFTTVEVPITWGDRSNSKANITRDALSMLRCLVKRRAEIRGR